LPGRQSLPIDVAGAIAVSPDGSKFAYIAQESGKSQLYLRPIDRFEPLIVPGTEGAFFPMFSADGQWVFFFTHGHLRKAAANGGAEPQNVVDVSTFYGGAALPDGSLLVSTSDPVLGIVPPQGGTVKALPLPSRDRLDPGAPIMLPGGEWTVFTDDKVNNISILALKISTGEVRALVPNASQPTYVSGYLLYDSAGTVYAAPFDVKSVRITGPAVAIAQDVAARNFFAHYSASARTLVYAPGAGTSAARNLFSVDRRGNGTKLDVPSEDYVDPTFSPDGKHFVVCIRNLNEQSLAVYDQSRALLMKMASNGLRNVAPIWSADGKTLFFDATGQGAKHGFYRLPADGSAAPVLLHELSANAHMTSISGNYASVSVTTSESGLDLWTLDLSSGDMKPFRASRANERQGSYSPDGRFLAYASDDSGNVEIYVESSSGSGARWQISNGGGDQPRWSRNGHEIFYRNGTKMMSVAVQMSPFSAAKPVELFDVNFDRGGAVPGYDVSPDGQRFLMTLSEHPNPTEIRVVVGWLELLKQKSATSAP
jgi:Tol biopolymer transport system component